MRILGRVKHMQYLTEYFLTDLDVEALANEPLSPEQQLLLDEDTRQRFIDERKKDEAEQRLSDYYQNIDRVELMLNRERLRARFGDQALWLYDQYRASALVSGAVDRVKNIYDHLLGEKNVAQEHIEEVVNSSLGVPVDEAILSVLRATVRTANDPALVHYGYYAERYNSYTSSGMAADQAHNNALIDLKDMLIKPDIDFLLADSDRLGEYWNYDNFRDQVKPGGLYDVVFQQLGGGYDVGVNR